MPRLRVFPQSTLWVILVVGLTVPLAYWLLAKSGPTRWFADRLHAQMLAADADRIDFYAGQLAALEFEGWSALLAAEHSLRPEVVRAARRAITDLVDSWRRLPPDMATVRVRELAKMLAESRTDDSESLHFRADLAESLLAWPTGGRPGVDLVFHCEQLLRAAKKVGWPKRPEFDAAPEPPPVLAVATEATPRPSASEQLSSPATAINAMSDSGERIASSGESDRELPEGDARSISHDSAPFGPSPELFFVPSSQQAAQLRSPPGEPLVQSNASPSSEASAPDWPRLNLIDLLQHLRDADLAPSAESELRRRGCNELNLRVARTAADESIENRLKLVRLLPELPGLDTFGWLLVLARDESPRVREAAVQLLSTANNPRVQRELEQLDQTETDDAVRSALRSFRMNSR